MNVKHLKGRILSSRAHLFKQTKSNNAVNLKNINKLKQIDPKVLEIVTVRKQPIHILENRVLTKQEANQILSQTYSAIKIESVDILKNAESIFDKDSPIPTIEEEDLRIDDVFKNPRKKINFLEMMSVDKAEEFDCKFLSLSVQKRVVSQLSRKHPKSGRHVHLDAIFQMNLGNQLDGYIISAMASVKQAIQMHEWDLKNIFRDSKMKILKSQNQDVDIPLPTFSIKGRIENYLEENPRESKICAVEVMSKQILSASPKFGMTWNPSMEVDPAPVFANSMFGEQSCDTKDILAPIYGNNPSACNSGFPFFGHINNGDGGLVKKFSLFQNDPQNFHFAPNLNDEANEPATHNSQPVNLNPGILTISSSKSATDSYFQPTVNNSCEYFRRHDTSSNSYNQPTSLEYFPRPTRYVPNPPDHIPPYMDRIPSPSQLFTDLYQNQYEYPQYGQPMTNQNVWAQNYNSGYYAPEKKKFGILNESVLADMKRMGVQLNTP